MPRKARKTEKPPLLFVERASCRARLQNVPEVRAALNPKEFFTERRAHDSSASKSWVSPQFDSSTAAVPPARRGRRTCQSATSILESCSQLSRKRSVCKFPSLSFQTRSSDRPHQPKSTRAKKAAEPTAVGKQSRGSGQIKRTVSSAQHSDTPKRQLTSIRKRDAERCSDGAASSSRCLDKPETASVHTRERCGVQEDDVLTPVSREFSGVGPPADVETPKVMEEGSDGPPSTSLHLLRLQPCTTPPHQPCDILAADTPERDYGVKVTWRRRRGLMLLLKERGHLSDSEAFIHS